MQEFVDLRTDSIARLSHSSHVNLFLGPKGLAASLFSFSEGISGGSFGTDLPHNCSSSARPALPSQGTEASQSSLGTICRRLMPSPISAAGGNFWIKPSFGRIEVCLLQECAR